MEYMDMGFGESVTYYSMCIAIMLIFPYLFSKLSHFFNYVRKQINIILLRNKIEKLSENNFFSENKAPSKNNVFYNSIIETYIEYEKINRYKNISLLISVIITIILIIYISIIIVSDFHHITIKLLSLSNFIQNNPLIFDFFNKQNLFSMHHIPWKFYEINAISFLLSILILFYSIFKFLRLSWKHFYIPSNSKSFALIPIFATFLICIFYMDFTMSFLSSFKIIFFLYPLIFYLVHQILFLIIFPFILLIYIKIIELFFFIYISIKNDS